jgi:alpha-1,2-mannosyltransferase
MPLTWFSFPVAAWIWLALNMGLLLVSSVVLADLAGYRGWRARGVIFALVVTFGPVFLDLTLGQTSVVLLVATLAMGRCLNIRDGRGVFLATSAAALAVGCKLFPLSWLPAWPLLRRWREAVVGGILVLAIGGLSAVVSPIGSREYWAYLFEERLQTASSVPSVDDQALLAWLDRLVLPLSFDVSGFGVERRTTVVWSPPWTADAGVVRWFGYGLIGLLLLLMLYLLLRSAPDHQEAGFYLWILFGLVALLHIERYNHVLLLPPMAWLWRRGKRQRRVVVAAYTLVGLARLTHLWAMLLPAPWGPLASGFGLYAALGLGGAMVACLWPYHGVVAQEPAWPESQAG